MTGGRLEAEVRRAGLAIFALALLSAVPLAAGEVFLGTAAHDLDLGFGPSYEPGVDVVAGLRTAPLTRLWGAEVRGHVLGSVNTDHGVNFAAIGATLRWHVAGRWYVAPGVGVAIADGPQDKFQRTNDRLYLGSRFLFEPEVAFGAQVTRRLAVEIAYVHLSHAQLAGPQNPGLDTLGARLVLGFGGRP